MQTQLQMPWLRYLLEPPEDFEPIALEIHDEMHSNCFHCIAASKGAGKLESLASFRYVFERCKALGQQDLLNQEDKNGVTPLIAASLACRVELVREMLQAGANPNIVFITAGIMALSARNRLRKSPTVPPHHSHGHIYTKREARQLEKDLESIVLLCRQFDGQEPKTSSGRPRSNWPRDAVFTYEVCL